MLNTLYNYDTNILNIHYVKQSKITKTVAFQNNKIKPSKNNKKKKDDNILDILDESNDIIYNISIYPIDTIADLKKKISIIFNVEWYKITLYWYENNTTKTSYNIYVDDKLYTISFDNITEIDSYLYNNKNDIHIASTDEILIVNYFIMSGIKDIYFIYIDDHININNLVSNKLNLDYIYYNFIIKFFPMFTYDLFYDYVFYNSNFLSKYRELININSNLTHYNNIYTILNKKSNPDYDQSFKYKKIIFRFNNIIKTKNNVNIRNIFDMLHINDFNIIKMMFFVNNKLYKKENKYDDTKLFSSEITYNALTIYIKNKYNETKPIFFKIFIKGEIEIIINISEHYNVSMDDIIEYLQKEINPILESLNKNKSIYNIFSAINNISKSYVKWNQNCNVKCTIIQKIKDLRFNNINNFNKLIESLSNYNNIFNKITKDENDIIKFYMHSGVDMFNVDIYHNFYPDKPNYYSIYSSTKDMANWKEKYTGLLIKFIYNMNYLEIYLKNINYNDIKNILFLLNSIIFNIDTKNVKHIESNKNKQLKKLKTVDPVMFSFEHSKESNRKYSKICQKPFHPIIYTKDELKNLSNDVKKKLVEFINATTKEKVYYECNSKKAPYLGFIVNEHPNDYCIPCCRVKEQSNKDNYNSCIKDYKYTKKTDKTEQYIESYILKNIESNRLSELPSVLQIIFNKSFPNKYINTKPFYIYGIQGILNIINFCNNCNASEIDSMHKHKINLFIFNKQGELDTEYYFKYPNFILIYFDDLYYYPIINSLDVKIYNESNDIIKFFIKIFKKNESISNSSFFHFEYIDKHFKILKIFVNNKNFIYGVYVNMNSYDIYIPVIYYYNITEYKSEKFISNSIINIIHEKNVIKFLEKHNFDENISKYMYSNILKKYIGLLVEFNSYTLTFLFKPETHDVIVFDVDSVDIVTIYYPIHFLSEKIMNDDYSITLNEFSLDYFEIYYKNLYKLILHEISFYFYSNHNIKIRDEIFDIIDDNNTLNVIFVSLQAIIPDDYNDVIILINEHYKINNGKLTKNKESFESFIKALNHTKFVFDDDLKYEYIKNASFTDVDKLFDRLFVFKPMNQIKIKHNIKNILMPCKMMNNEYCDKNKLIIPSEYRNKFITLFYTDIKNPFKNINLLNNIISVDDHEQFTINLNEKITIEPFTL